MGKVGWERVAGRLGMDACPAKAHLHQEKSRGPILGTILKWPGHKIWKNAMPVKTFLLPD